MEGRCNKTPTRVTLALEPVGWESRMETSNKGNEKMGKKKKNLYNRLENGDLSYEGDNRLSNCHLQYLGRKNIYLMKCRFG